MPKVLDMIDVFMARDFLRAICRIPDGDPDPFFVFQTVDDRKTADADRPEMRNIYQGTLLERSRVLTLLNRDGAGVFAQINEGPNRGKSHIVATRALWIDDDLKHVDRPDLTRLPPSIIVRTRPRSSPERMHAFWLTERNIDLLRWERAQSHLALAHGTDQSMAKLDQCMRMPGFLHGKPGKEPERSELIKCDTKLCYTIDQILDAYPTVRKTFVDVPLDIVDDIKAQPPEPITGDSSPAAMNTRKRILTWLNSKGIKYIINARNPRVVRLHKCPFNSDHIDSAAFIVYKTGSIKWGCFHESCGENKKNRWRECRDLVGDWEDQLDRGDHIEMARRLAEELQADSCMPLITDGETYRYDDEKGLWTELSANEIQCAAMDFSGMLIGSSNRVCKLKETDIRGIAKTLGAITQQIGFFKDAPSGALFTNGFLTIEEQQLTLKPFSPEYRCRVAYPFAYNEDADAPRWLQYLREVFDGDVDCEDKILLLQEFIGACLLGRATHHQKSLYLVGGGANGKSVTLDVVASLFPTNARTAVNPQDFSDPFYKILFDTARVNLVTEVPERDIFDTAPYKAIVDGSETLARHPYGRPRKIKPCAGHIFACNTLPGSADMSDGFWRRSMVLSYNRKFEEEKADRDLTQKIIEQRAGVCVWALRGAARLTTNNKYTCPASAREVKEEWRIEADAVALYVREAVVLGGETSAENLYQAFKSWANDNGHKQMTKIHFCRRLNQLGYVSVKKQKYNAYSLTLNYKWSHFNTKENG